MANSDVILCYNKGCGQKYNPDENKDDSCSHHPGVPVFHDALKGWSCCKKRCTDFTEFLNISGCTTGPHTNVKPPEPEQSEGDGDTITQNDTPVIVPKEQVIVKPPPKLERPPVTDPLVCLHVTVASSLQQALEKHLKDLAIDTKEATTDENPTDIKKGTPCKNASCKTQYEDESTNTEICNYHSGAPIFHEGLKYWTCCQRKTCDFNTFLNQEGCQKGKHVWYKKESAEKKVACRLDWHQTTGFVIISIFAKVVLPEKSFVEANKVSTKISIVFEGGKSHFKKDMVLSGIIDPEKSSVKMLGTKVEINMKKAEPGHWTKLELPEAKSS